MSTDAARLACAACAICSIALTACEPSAMVGMYTDGGARCDPLGAECGVGRACTVRADPAMDACRPIGALAIGASCDALDACEAGAQCAMLGSGMASLDPALLSAGGVCARLCARDAPTCGAGESCLGIADGNAVRIDYGVCAP